MSTDVERLRELAEAATPGPWEYEDEWATETVYHPAKVLALGEVDYWSGDSNEYVVAQGGPGDMAFIAAANPATVLALLDELAETVAERDTMQAERDMQASWSTDDGWLRDQHARYHDQSGNMLGRDECGEERCDFWDAAVWVLNAPGRPVPLGIVEPSTATA